MSPRSARLGISKPPWMDEGILIGGSTGWHAYKQTGGKADRQMNSRQTDNQAGRQMDTWADSHADGQTGRQTYIWNDTHVDR